MTTTPESEVEPDVGGNPSNSSADAVVVWQEIGGGIVGAEVAVPSAVPVPSAAVTLSTSVGASQPAITQGAGPGGRHVVAWTDRGRSADVRARLIDGSMHQLSAELVVASDNDLLPDEPDVAGEGDDFCVVWQQAESVGAVRHDIYCQPIQFDPRANAAQQGRDAGTGGRHAE